MDTRVIRHKGYDLHCGARITDSGGFVPVLMVARAAWPSRPRIIAVGPGAFPSEEAAAESAHAQGVEWVTNYGESGRAAP